MNEEKNLEVKKEKDLISYGAELAEGKSVANMLRASLDRKEKKVFFNNREYAEIHELQIIPNYFGHSISTPQAVPVEIGGVHGFKAHAEMISKSGIPLGQAEAYCMQDEPNWAKKPLFQLASMAQTRAAGKCITNNYRWILDLANCGTTPAEEMDLPASSQMTAPFSPPIPQTIRPPMSKTMPNRPYGKPTISIENLFDAPVERTANNAEKSKYWKTMDAQGKSYTIFDATIAAYLAKKVGEMLVAQVDVSSKGSLIVHLSETNIANA